VAKGEYDSEADALEQLLGVEGGHGFHIEFLGRGVRGFGPRVRGDGTRFPCIDADNRYTGCLGSACQSLSCWAGELVPTAHHAVMARSLPIFERAGAKCHLCRNAVDGPEGRLTCANGHFDMPITVACLVRHRVPEKAPIPCPDFEAADTLRPEVQEYRERKRLAQARRDARRQTSAA
jgi:hypothetical protein